MADDVDLDSQHEEAFRQHHIAHYREEELLLTGRCYNCEDPAEGRISQYSFIENQDYVIVDNLSFPKSGSAKSRQQPIKDYAISIDMAKELSMVERNEKGKEARQYFIQCEKQAKAIPTDPIQMLNDPAAMRSILLTYTEKVIALESKVEEMAPD
uniref:AntA domain-containing protein n=1 Tax=Glossina pallidipes TaxID=7398 RepID=A0A1A9Z2J2_GLOPL